MMRKSVRASMEDMHTMTTDQKIDNLTTMVMELRNELLKFIKTKPATVQAPTSSGGAVETKVVTSTKNEISSQSRPNFLKHLFITDESAYKIAIGIDSPNTDPYSYPRDLLLLNDSNVAMGLKDIEDAYPKIKGINDKQKKRKEVGSYIWSKMTDKQRVILGKYQTLRANRLDELKKTNVDPEDIDSNSDV